MLMNNNEYIEIIETIKGEIRGAQYKAALSVNRELIMSKPIGVSEYKITSRLPEALSKQLPSVEDIQKRIKN